MLSVEGKLYRVLTSAVEVIAAHAAAAVLSLPFYTLPVSVWLYCRLMGNIVTGRRFLAFRSPTRQGAIRTAAGLAVGFCVMLSIDALSALGDAFLGILIISFLISFWMASTITLSERGGELRVFQSFRAAFIYTAARLHKSVLPIFVLLQTIRVFNGFLTIYAVLILLCAAGYVWFRLNKALWP